MFQSLEAFGEHHPSPCCRLDMGDVLSASFHMPRIYSILLAALVVTAFSSCAGNKKHRPSLPANATGMYGQVSEMRAIREARSALRRRSNPGDYDMNSATAYDKGDYWNVCFKPSKGKGKPFFKRCLEIKKK